MSKWPDHEVRIHTHTMENCLCTIKYSAHALLLQPVAATNGALSMHVIAESIITMHLITHGPCNNIQYKEMSYNLQRILELHALAKGQCSDRQLLIHNHIYYLSMLMDTDVDVITSFKDILNFADKCTETGPGRR